MDWTQCFIRRNKCSVCGKTIYYDPMWWTYRCRHYLTGTWDYQCSWGCLRKAQEAYRAKLKKRGRKPKRPQWDMEFRGEDASGY